MNGPRSFFGITLVMSVAFFCFGAMAYGGSLKLVFFDPDTFQHSPTELNTKFTVFLKTVAPNVEFQPVKSQEVLAEQLADPNTLAVIAPREVLARAVDLSPSPALLPSRNGATTLKVFLVAKIGATKEEIAQGRIGLASPGSKKVPRGDLRRKALMDWLEISWRQLDTLPLSTEVNLLADMCVNDAQLGAVWVNELALERILASNFCPDFEKRFEPFRKFSPIERAPLVFIGKRGGPKLRAAIKSAFLKMHESAQGQALLKYLAADKWVPVKAGGARR